MDNKIAFGSIGILALLLAFGGTVYLTQDQQNHAYICSTNQQVYLFDKLSSTNKTGYWTENGTQKSIACKNGVFTKVLFPTEPETPVSPVLENTDQSIHVQYLCNQNNCTRIK